MDQENQEEILQELPVGIAEAEEVANENPEVEEIVEEKPKIPDFIYSEKCTMEIGNGFLTNDNSSFFCKFCFFFCQNYDQNQNTNLANNSQIQCSCNHVESNDFFKEKLAILKNVENFKTEKVFAINVLLNHKSEDKDCISLAYPHEKEALNKIIQLQKDGNLKVSSLDINLLKKANNLLRDFIFELNTPTLLKLNVSVFLNLFPFDFAQSLISTDSYFEGCDHFDEILHFEDLAFNYFIRSIMIQDFINLDFVNSIFCESQTPLARQKIRDTNQANTALKEKYFSSKFNLFEFAKKLFHRYLPFKTFRIPHGTYSLSIKIFVLLSQHGLLNEDQINDMIELLFIKLENFLIFESEISNNLQEKWDSTMFPKEECAIISKTLKIYIAKIIMEAIFYKQDKELISILRNCVESSSKFTNLEILLQKIVFKPDYLFKSDFGKKTLHILLKHNILQSFGEANPDKKLANVLNKYLMLLSNINDQFLLSMQLLTINDILNYFSNDQKTQTSDFSRDKHLKELNEMFSNLSKNVFDSNQLNEFAQAFIELIQKNVDLSKQAEDYSEKELLTLQKRLFSTGFVKQIISRTEAFANTISGEFLSQKIASLMKLFMWNNYENQSILMSENYFEELKPLLDKHPLHILRAIAQVFEKTPRVLKAKEELIYIFFLYHETNRTTRLMEENLDRIKISIELLKIFSLYISENSKKDFVYIPEYEILVADHLSAIIHDRYGINDFKTLLNDPDMYSSLVKDHAILLMDVLRKAMRYRFTRKTFDNLSGTIDFDIIIEIVQSLEDLDEKAIFLELFTHLHIDFKNNLLNQRNNFFIRRPVDMQYDEDINYARPYKEYILGLLNEISIVMGNIEKRPYEKEVQAKAVNFIANSLLFPLYKAFNLFSLIKDNDLTQLNDYTEVFKKLNDIFYHKTESFAKIFNKNKLITEEMKKDRAKEKMERYRCKDEFLKERLRKKYYIKFLKKFIRNCMEQCELQSYLKAMLSQKPSEERMKSRIIEISLYSNKRDEREQGCEQYYNDVVEKLKRKGINLNQILTLKYQLMKHSQISNYSKSNVLLNALNESKFEESQLYAENLAKYLNVQLSQDYTYGHKTAFYHYVECLTNLLYSCTNTIQKSFFTTVKENIKPLDKVYLQMKFIMNYLKHKNTFDKYYKETYFRTLLFLRFHQFLCLENCISFKELFKDKNLPDDSVDRVQRFTTIYQRTTDLCEYHNNYDPNLLTDMDELNRSHLILMCAYCFEGLAEFTSGPYEPNQIKIYRYIYDRYNGTLKRYMTSADSHFYDLKNSLCDFMIAMADGLSEEVVNFLTINYELTTLNDLMINSIAQLFYDYRVKHKLLTPKLISRPGEFPLDLKDFNGLITTFNSDPAFRSHTLLHIAIKTYRFIVYISNVRTKFKMHINDRFNALKGQLSQDGAIALSTFIEEKDLVVWKFLNGIVFPIEFVNLGGKLDKIFYVRPTNFSFLSKNSKNKFLEIADRKSHSSKIGSLIENIPNFQKDIETSCQQEKAFGKGKIMKFVFSIENSFIHKSINLVALILNLQIFLLMLTEDFNSFETRKLGISLCAFAIWIFSCFGIFKWFKQDSLLAFSNGESLLQAFKASVDLKLFVFHLLMVFLGLKYSLGFFAFELRSVIFSVDSFKFIGNVLKRSFKKYSRIHLFGFLILFVYSIFFNFTVRNNLDEQSLSENFKANSNFILHKTSTGFLFQSTNEHLSDLKNIFTQSKDSKSDLNTISGFYFLQIVVFAILNLLFFNFVFVTLDSLTALRREKTKKGSRE